MQVETRVDSVWCQLLKLKYDNRLSRFAFNINLRPYSENDLRSSLKRKYGASIMNLKAGTTAIVYQRSPYHPPNSVPALAACHSVAGAQAKL